MFRPESHTRWAALVLAGLLLMFSRADAQQAERGQSSYMPVDITEPFASIMARLSAAKPAVEQEHNALLNERYDLGDRPAQGVTMDRGKPVQEGVRVKLPAGTTWDSLAAMSPDSDPRPEPVPKRLLPAAASQAPGGRLCISPFRHRRDQAAGRARPRPVRH